MNFEDFHYAPKPIDARPIPEPHIVELPVKGRMTVKLPSRAEWERQEQEQQGRIKLLPERAASRMERKRVRFGLLRWVWPAEKG